MKHRDGGDFLWRIFVTTIMHGKREQKCKLRLWADRLESDRPESDRPMSDRQLSLT